MKTPPQVIRVSEKLKWSLIRASKLVIVKRGFKDILIICYFYSSWRKLAIHLGKLMRMMIMMLMIKEKHNLFIINHIINILLFHF